MAFARDTYVATASQTDFVITYPYLAETDVIVYQNGSVVSTDDYIFATAAKIRLDTGATVGDSITLQRNTTQATRRVDFTAGPVVEADLDNSALQLFYMSQESIDKASLSLGADAALIWDAEDTRIKDVGTPTLGGDAVNKNYADALALGTIGTPISLALGGTGATSASAARTALGLGSLATLSTVGAAQITDNSVALAEMEHGTAGDVLYYGASGTPTRLAKGADGTVLKLASGLPSWVVPATGYWDHVSTTAVASGTVTEVVVNTLAAGYDYRITLSGVVAASATAGFRSRISTDNGSSWETANYNYAYHYVAAAGVDALAGSASAAEYVLVSSGLGASLNDTMSLVYEIFNPRAAQMAQSRWEVHTSNGSSNVTRFAGNGRHKVAADIDAIQFYFSSGNFTASTGSIIVERAAFA